MFSTLMATRPTRDRSANGTLASITIHGLVFATLIFASAQRDTEVFTNPGERIIPIDAYRPPAPTPPAAPKPVPPKPSVPTEPTPVPPEVPTLEVPTAPTEIPTDIPVPGDLTTLPSEPAPSAPGGTGTGEPTGEPGLPSDGALSAGEVDRPVVMLSHSPLPRYPESLRSSRLEGGVRVIFIVDANGRVEMGSVRIVEATHPLFEAAVRSALPRMRFRPAQSGSRRVRQLVEIPFGFTLAGR